MTHEECLKAALLRPRDFLSLPAEDQWMIDKELGILDWEGPKNLTETLLLAKHHGLDLKRKDNAHTS